MQSKTLPNFWFGIARSVSSLKIAMRLLALSLLTAASSQAAVSLTYSQTANNALWPSAPSGYNSNSYEFIPGTSGSYSGRQGFGFYDAFTIHAQGDANAPIASLTLSLRFDGKFDDSVAIDLNGDGTIDYALSYDNLSNTNYGSFYAPWSSSTDAANLGIVLTITASGTTASSYIYGVSVSNGGNGRVDDLSGITLSSLGLGMLDGNGEATSTGSFRIGFLNQYGNGGGLPLLSSVNFNYNPSLTYTPAVPEPSTYGFALGGLALLGAILRRRKRA